MSFNPVKAFQKLQEQVLHNVTVVENGLNDWKALVNKDLEAFKKKYDEMHGVLLRKFLVDLEGRVRHSEVNSIALVRLYVLKFYELEKKFDPTFNLTLAEFQKKLSEDLNQTGNQVQKEMEKDDATMAMEQEKSNEVESQQ